MAKLGFGFMRLPTKYGKIDYNQVNQMVDEYISQGFNYFDTAWPYLGGKSEIALRECVVKRYPREAIQIADKFPSYEKPNPSRIDDIFNEQLEKCGVEYFDYYLIHDIDYPNRSYVKDNNLYEKFLHKKAEGKIRHLGFSFHGDAKLLEEVLNEFPQCEFVQLQINYLDWDSTSIQSRKCYEIAKEYDVPVIVMEPIKGGKLVDLPSDALKIINSYDSEITPAMWALKFCNSLSNVCMILSGMSTLEQVKENTRLFNDMETLNDDELNIIKLLRNILKGVDSIGCTACRYCVDQCPMRIPIPDYISLYNSYKYNKKVQRSTDTLTQQYKELSSKDENGLAFDCFACKKCEDLCPQHIEIHKEMRKISEIFDGKK